jgi:hypothetical protein
MAQHYDNAHPPTERGLYYCETCNSRGEPVPGFWWWDEGKPIEMPTIPAKLFGPIPGAMKPWPMVPAESGR